MYDIIRQTGKPADRRIVRCMRIIFCHGCCLVLQKVVEPFARAVTLRNGLVQALPDVICRIDHIFPFFHAGSEYGSRPRTGRGRQILFFLVRPVFQIFSLKPVQNAAQDAKRRIGRQDRLIPEPP